MAGDRVVVTDECSYDMDNAKAAIAGYAFAPAEPAFDSPKSPSYGELPDEQKSTLWAYRSYDCIQTPQYGFDPIDILVVDGLNGQLNAAAVSNLLLIRPHLAECFDWLDRNATKALWELDDTAVDDSGPKEQGTQEWWMHRAWWLLSSTKHSGIAVTHKILHRVCCTIR